ncbi:MAG: tryptophan--tRNA ligase [Clostridiales bacterium]|nr:tryptophan--tRNA ligase [Clostridiales bacterium]
MKRYLTGIKPTGIPHIGNYFGAIKPAIEFSNSADNEAYYFIADYHALTSLQTGKELVDYTYELASTWLACGLDPNKVVFYKQSDVPETFELNWILCNVTPKGLMNRAHAYKAIVEKNAEAGVTADEGINMGLYNYPILMAADILLVDSDYVPVGLDQKQHIEIARDIAHNFNIKYGNILKSPMEHIEKEVATLEGLDGRKMSKSYGNIIPLFCDEKTLQKTINRIVTDSSLPTDPKPLDCTINKLYKLFATEEEIKAFEKRLSSGIGWGDAKKALFEVMNRFITPMREKYNYYMSHRSEVDEILRAGAEKARRVARKTLDRVRKAIGCK